MKVCIDTNAYSDFMRGDAHVAEILETADEIYVPSVVIGELTYGFLLGKKLDENESVLNDFLTQDGVKVLQITKGIAERYGYVKASLKVNGTFIPENDVWIAAAALETGARLVTKDKHFDYVAGLIKV